MKYNLTLGALLLSAQDTAMLDTPREYWSKDYWTWLNIAKHDDKDWKHHDGCCESVAQAVKGETWFIPPAHKRNRLR